MMIAAVAYSKNAADALATLWFLVDQLRAEGRKAGGFLNPLTAEGRVNGDVVASVADGRRYTILHPRSEVSKACRLNDQALADSALLIKEAVSRQVEVLFVNKFGMAEAEGRGLHQDMIMAVSEGIPVITTLKERYLPEWRAFSGESGAVLAPDPIQIRSWLNSAGAG